MLILKQHNGSNKQSWISFYNGETAGELIEQEPEPFRSNRNTIAHVFKATSKATGINISAQTLRAVFAREMNTRGVSDRHIDAFYGKVPQSILARNYSDYSPEVLKEIYEKANLKILH